MFFLTCNLGLVLCGWRKKHCELEEVAALKSLACTLWEQTWYLAQIQWVLGKSAVLKPSGGKKKVYLRVEISKTGREDSLAQGGWEIKQKYAISVWIHPNIKNMSILSRCAISHSKDSRSMTCSRGTSTDNGAVIRMDSPWTANAVWEILSRFHNSWPRLSSLLPWFSC